MKTFIRICIAVLFVLSCSSDKSTLEGPPGSEVQGQVLANMFTVENAARAFAVANGGEYPANLSAQTPDGRTLIAFLPGGQRLINPVTGRRTDPVYFEPDGLGSTAYRGFLYLVMSPYAEHCVGYRITGHVDIGEMWLEEGPDSVISKDRSVIYNCQIVQSAADAFAAGNNGVYALDNSEINLSGNTIQDYLPGGQLLLNPYTYTRTEPSWDGPALGAGQSGYVALDVDGNGFMDGYQIDGVSGDGVTLIAYICTPDSLCN